MITLMPKKGYRQTEEHRMKIGNASLGHIHTEETKEKIRQGKLGDKNPMKNPIFRAKMAASRKRSLAVPNATQTVN